MAVNVRGPGVALGAMAMTVRRMFAMSGGHDARIVGRRVAYGNRRRKRVRVGCRQGASSRSATGPCCCGWRPRLPA